MGGVFGKPKSPKKAWMPESKLEARMVEALQWREAVGPAIRSFNNEDSNDAIDQEELRKCFHKLEIAFTEEEINDLFDECDINEERGISFNEFIVLLCIVYLLKDDPSSHRAKLQMGMPDLEATFETLVNAFVFLDKNKDGYVGKNELEQAINESVELPSGRIAMKRFEEMDCDKNGMVSFKEFLFAFTRWVGLDDVEDEDLGEKVSHQI